MDALSAPAIAYCCVVLVLVYGSSALWLSWRPLPPWKLPLPVMLPLTGTIVGFVLFVSGVPLLLK